LALGEAGPKAKAATNELAAFVASKEPEYRMQALITLGEIGPDAKSAAPAIIKALGDEQMSVRYAATFALGKIGAKDAVAEITKQLNSKDNFLKMVSAWSLAKISPNDKTTVDNAVKMLVDALKDPDKHVRAAAARGLFELNVPREQVIPALADLLAEKDPQVRGHVVDALASLGEKALPRLIKALQHDDTQGLAVAVIRQLGPKAKDAVPALAEELKDPDAAYRREVCFALASIGPGAKPAVPALVKALSDADEGVRHIATYALGKIGPDAAAAAPDLKKNLASDDLFLKTASVWALVHIEPKDLDFRVKAVPILAKALAESDRERVRMEVATTLGEIGPTAKDAIPALEKRVAEDDSAAVREAAEMALKKIRQTK
jgi:HEAT repeat protein